MRPPEAAAAQPAAATATATTHLSMNLAYCGRKGKTERTQQSTVTATLRPRVGSSVDAEKHRPAPHQSPMLSLELELMAHHWASITTVEG